MGMGVITGKLSFLLELDGKLAGRFFQFDGGGAKAEVVTVAGGGAFSQKHISSVSYDDMTLACGTGMSHAFYDWLGASFSGKAARRTGAVILLDQNSKARERMDFYEALVTSLVLPKLNRASNDKAVMKVKVAPERTSFKEGDGSQKLGVYTGALPKAWTIGSFKIQIDGLSKECTHVTQISSLKLGQGVKPDNVGEMRDANLEPTKIEFSDLELVLPGAFADGFYKWHEDMVVKGNSGSSNEKKGTVDFLAPGSSSPYFSVKLGGLGIMSMNAQGGRLNKTSPVTVGLYCEQMTFSAGAAAIK